VDISSGKNEGALTISYLRPELVLISVEDNASGTGVRQVVLERYDSKVALDQETASGKLGISYSLLENLGIELDLTNPDIIGSVLSAKLSDIIIFHVRSTTRN